MKPIPMKRDNDDQPEAGMTRAADTMHQPGHHVAGHGFHKPRNVVVAHDHMPSVGHAGGLREPHDCTDCPPSAANKQFNDTVLKGAKETSDPGRIVGSGIKLS